MLSTTSEIQETSESVAVGKPEAQEASVFEGVSPDIENLAQMLVGEYEPAARRTSAAKQFFESDPENESETGSLDDLLDHRVDFNVLKTDRVMIPRFSDLFGVETPPKSKPIDAINSTEDAAEKSDNPNDNICDSSEEEDDIWIVGMKKGQKLKESIYRSRADDQVECLEYRSSKPQNSRSIDLTQYVQYRTQVTNSQLSLVSPKPKLFKSQGVRGKSPGSEIEAFGSTMNQEMPLITCGCTSTTIPCQSQKCQCSKAGLTCSIYCKCGPMCQIPGEDKKLRQLKDVVPFLRQKLIDMIKRSSGDGYLRDSDLVLERALHGVKNPESRVSIEKQFKMLEGIKKMVVAKEINACQAAIERRKKAEEWLNRKDREDDSESNESDGQQEDESSQMEETKTGGLTPATDFQINSAELDEILEDASPKIKIPEEPPEGYAMRSSPMQRPIVVDQSEENMSVYLNKRVRGRGRPPLNFKVEKQADFDALTPSQKRKFLTDLQLQQEEFVTPSSGVEFNQMLLGFVTQVPQPNAFQFEPEQYGFSYRSAHMNLQPEGFPVYDSYHDPALFDQTIRPLYSDLPVDDLPMFDVSGSSQMDFVFSTDQSEMGRLTSGSESISQAGSQLPYQFMGTQPQLHTLETAVRSGQIKSISMCVPERQELPVQPSPLFKTQESGVFVVSSSIEKQSSEEPVYVHAADSVDLTGYSRGGNAGKINQNESCTIVKASALPKSTPKVIEVDRPYKYVARQSVDFGSGSAKPRSAQRVHGAQVVEVSAPYPSTANVSVVRSKQTQVVNLTQSNLSWSSSGRNPAVIELGSQTVLSGSHGLAQQLKKFSSQRGTN